MSVGDIGIGALDAASKVGADEQVEDSIDAVGRDPLAARLRHRLGDVIGGRRLVEPGKSVEHRCAHVGPLLAALGHPPSGGVAQRVALMKLVGVSGHERQIGFLKGLNKRLRTSFCSG